jgi:hypothetical protein
MMVCGAEIISGSLLKTVPEPPLTTTLSASAVLPPAKVRFPLPIVMVPPDQEPNVLPDPPLTVTFAWLSISTLPMIWPVLASSPLYWTDRYSLGAAA